MARTLLLDTSSLMYRAFFAIPQQIRDPEGRPANAVHGYLDMCATLVSARKPNEVVHVYDADWRPAPRVALYAGYKATRQPDPEPLPRQFDVLREVLDALGQPQAEAPGWEAEDAIGSICAAAGRGESFDVVTGDRDLTQLVRDPSIRVLFTLRGVSQLRVLDEAGVLEHFGVPADRYIDYAILRGDHSDALPGVRGIGEKTARELVNEYPDLDAMVAEARAPRRPGRLLQRSLRMRAAMIEAADYLEVMKQVVPIRRDLDVVRWQREPLSADAVEEVAARNGVLGPVRRLLAAIAGERVSGR